MTLVAWRVMARPRRRLPGTWPRQAIPRRRSVGQSSIRPRPIRRWRWITKANPGMASPASRRRGPMSPGVGMRWMREAATTRWPVSRIEAYQGARGG